MKKIIGYIVFVIVQTLFIPFAIIGFLIVFYKQMYVSKKLGVSSTAVEIINGRWMMDKFGIRKDPATVQLFKVMPNTSSLGLWLVLYPLYLLRQITGENIFYPVVKSPGEETFADMVISRTLYIDDILRKSFAKSEQFVIMGAGFDTRCYGHFVQNGINLFELDQKSTQQFKKDILKKAKINTGNIHFVDVDFASENWYDKLGNAGYDKNKVTTFLWEGVTLYLSEKDVRKTLGDIKNHVKSGSIIVVDFYSTQFVSGELYPGMKQSLKLLKMTDEELGFGVSFETDNTPYFEAFIESKNILLRDVHKMGSRTKKGTWMAVAELEV